MDKTTYRRWHTFNGKSTEPEIISETQYSRIHDWATQEMARTGDKYIRRSKFVDTGDGYEEVPHTEDKSCTNGRQSVLNANQTT